MRKSTKPRLVQVNVNGQAFWQVIAPRPEGRGRTRKTFKHLPEAKTYFENVQVDFLNRGLGGLAFTDSVRSDAAAALDILQPFGITLADAARAYAKTHKLQTTSESLIVALDRFLAAKDADGSRPRYVNDLRARLGRFVQDFPDRTVASVTAGEVGDWLGGLAVAPLTRNTFWLRLSAFWTFAASRGWAPENILAAVPKAKVRADGHGIGILKPEELARVLEAAAPETLPYWLLGAFAGLRSAELERLEWSDIHFESGLVEVPALKSKTASRRFVEIQPNLAQWLAPYAGHQGKVTPRGLRHRLPRDRQAGRLTHWPSNALRHSFASYHLAHFQNAAALALQLGHTDQDLIFRHYRELVRPTAAARYWSIVPAQSASLVAIG